MIQNKTIKSMLLRTEPANTRSSLARVAVFDLMLEDKAGKLEARQVVGVGTNNAEAINDAFRLASYLVNQEIER